VSTLQKMKSPAAKPACHFINFWWQRSVFLLTVQQNTK